MDSVGVLADFGKRVRSAVPPISGARGVGCGVLGVGCWVLGARMFECPS